MLIDIFWTAAFSLGIVFLGFFAQVLGSNKKQLFPLSLPGFVFVYGILGLFEPTGEYVGISSPWGGPNHLHPPTMISIGALGLLGLFLLHRHQAKNISNPQANQENSMRIELDLTDQPELAAKVQEVSSYTGLSPAELLGSALKAYCEADGNALRNDLFAGSMLKVVNGVSDHGVPAFAKPFMSQQH